MKLNNLFKKLNTYHIRIISAVIILISVLAILFLNISTTKLLKEKPQDIVVANITTVDAQIYWKSPEDDIHRIYYKEASNTGIFKEIIDFPVYLDELNEQNIYVTTLDELEPNTEYLFRIESDNKLWDTHNFTTKGIAEELNIPTVAIGDDNDQSFLLVDLDGEKYMLNTQYHGTWAFDTQNKEYEISKYATYISKDELISRLNKLIPSPVYAQSGANCKTGIKVNSSSYPPSKSVVVDILNRWVGSCKLGGYPNECYEDVYCRALSAGVNPAFAITIWSNESGGSNYAYHSGVEDFGIHGLSSVPVTNFDKQANHFLSNIASRSESYISGCTGGNKVYAWGAKFLTGNCTNPANIDKGRTYMTGISEVYSWYTNKPLTWPFTVSKNSSACNYSSAYTNTTYNTCGAKGTPTSAPSNPTPSSSVPPGGDGSKDYMIVTGTGVTPKDRDCKDPDGCICLYGYTNSKPSSTLTISYGYTCTVDKKVIETPEKIKVCCNTDNSVSYVSSNNCKGTIIEGINENNCKARNVDIDLQTGVNFIEAYYILNKEEAPIDSARTLITYSGNRILAVGLFRNDRWEKIVKNENGNISGQDFNLEPGESYLVIASADFTIPVSVLEKEFSTKLESLKGWNLIPSSIFNGIASNSKSILQNTKYTFINQVAVWNEDISIFDYTLRDNSGSIYGDSLQIDKQDGFFIKIPQ